MSWAHVGNCIQDKELADLEAIRAKLANEVAERNAAFAATEKQLFATTKKERSTHEETHGSRRKQLEARIHALEKELAEARDKFEDEEILARKKKTKVRVLRSCCFALG